MTSYTDIYDAFLKRIEDAELAGLSESDIYERCNEWFESAIAYIELHSIKLVNDLSDRDDNNECFNTDLKKYEIELICMYMLVAWYTSKINSLETTTMFVGHKEEKWTSQKEHMNMLKDARTMQLNRARKFCRDYKYTHNAYLDE